jgi:NADP-dependent 3-hydroxy acid dehydrogenase YdfG
MKPIAMVLEAGGGVGLETSLELAQSGFHVFASVTSLYSSSTLSRRARERGVDVSLVTMNATSPTSVSLAVAEVLSYAGRLDVLVDAGSLALGPATEAALPTMRAAGGGRIVSVANASATDAFRERVVAHGVELVVVGEKEPRATARAVAAASSRRAHSTLRRLAVMLGLA